MQTTIGSDNNPENKKLGVFNDIGVQEGPGDVQDDPRRGVFANFLENQ